MSDDLALQQFDTRAQSAQTHCQTPRSQVTVLLLVILLLASFGLRVYRLGDKSVWWDEGLAAWAARRSLAEIARWTAADVHPPSIVGCCTFGGGAAATASSACGCFRRPLGC